jgi:hypothetical protein
MGLIDAEIVLVAPTKIYRTEAVRSRDGRRGPPE